MRPLKHFTDFHENSAEFSQVPFWFWNDDLNEKEIHRQLDDFKAHGIYAVVIHPRAGLPRHLAWMSDRLLNYMRVAIEHAKSNGMWIVLYDEAMYPSGSSGGQVVEANPDFACRCLIHIDLNESLSGPSTKYVKLGPKGVELDPNQSLIAEVTRKHDGHRIAIIDTPSHSHIRGVHFTDDTAERRIDHTEVPEERPPAGDLLNPEAMSCFIDLVHQRFYDEFGTYFGDTIKAIFTDEPDLLGKGAIRGAQPGTRDILCHVNRLLGYDFTEHLPCLWDDREPDAEKHRLNYHRAIRQRLEETYYQPISSWCRDHAIALAGHPEKSDDIAMLRHFQIPGQDVVWRYIEPGKETALEGPHSTMAKCASSAMLHAGQRRNLNEFAGAYGHNLSFREYRWIALWLLIRGCNMLCPHAFYYSIRGPRIDERPRDVGPNSPWWKTYREFSEMTGKLCWANTDSQHICSVAILGQDDRLPWKAAKHCFENQIDFNYLQNHYLLNSSSISENGISIGNMHYETLIVEKGYESTLGDKAEEVLSLLRKVGRLIEWNDEDGPDKLIEHLPKAASLSPPASELRVRRVFKDSRHYLIVFNEGENRYIGTITAPDLCKGSLIQLDSEEVNTWHNGQEIVLDSHDCYIIIGESLK